MAAKRIRAGRAACRFPRILEMIARGELHLSGVHQLAKYLTDENHEQVLACAKHKTMRQIEGLIAEIAPKPDVPSRIVTLPTKNQTKQTQEESAHDNPARPDVSTAVGRRAKAEVTSLAPRRYKLQVTVGQQTRDKLTELQELLSHQIPDGDPAVIVDRAFDALLETARKRKAALTTKPRKTSKRRKGKSRAIPAETRREVFKRDEGRCMFVDATGNRCPSRRFIEFHHRRPHGLGGTHEVENLELRCRAHNQYAADQDYGELFMATIRQQKTRPRPGVDRPS